jgi:hypothetical protein
MFEGTARGRSPATLRALDPGRDAAKKSSGGATHHIQAANNNSRLQHNMWVAPSRSAVLSVA